jgi:uncharacterized phage protein gp47/JayE
MFENITEEDLLERMLAAVPDTVDGAAIDKSRESSIIYNALAPAAQELYLLYTCLDDILDDAFADTAEREYLVRRAAERGMAPYPATNAVWRGEFNIDVEPGSAFTIDDVEYLTAEKIAGSSFRVVCAVPGAAGNEKSGTLIPVEYIDGLESAELVELLVPGRDEEDTEAFRERYFYSFQSQAFGGNKADYKQKAESLPGVGGVKVLPVWDGGGTVKLIITDSRHRAPTPALVAEVQEAFDPPPNGRGAGLAPIGHVVTVEGAVSVPVDVSATLDYEPGYDWGAVSAAVYGRLDAYYDELSKAWGAGGVVVRVTQIESRVLGVDGVRDITGTQINGVPANLDLGDALPERGHWNGS